MSAGTIWRCWAALMLLLTATTASAFVPLGDFNLVVSLCIAVAKALIVLLVFMVLPSTPGDNRYGANPYGEGAGGAIAAE